MRNRKLWSCLAAGSLVLALTVTGIWAQVRIHTLSIGAGALGKGPTAIVLPGYEDAPRPPAFDAKMRALVAELDKAVDTYTPQPAWAGQTRAPKPVGIAASEVETFAEGLTNPWSLNFLPDGRVLVSETRGGLRIIDKKGR